MLTMFDNSFEVTSKNLRFAVGPFSVGSLKSYGYESKLFYENSTMWTMAVTPRKLKIFKFEIVQKSQIEVLNAGYIASINISKVLYSRFPNNRDMYNEGVQIVTAIVEQMMQNPERMF